MGQTNGSNGTSSQIYCAQHLYKIIVLYIHKYLLKIFLNNHHKYYCLLVFLCRFNSDLLLGMQRTNEFVGFLTPL